MSQQVMNNCFLDIEFISYKHKGIQKWNILTVGVIEQSTNQIYLYLNDSFHENPNLNKYYQYRKIPVNKRPAQIKSLPNNVAKLSLKEIYNKLQSFDLIFVYNGDQDFLIMNYLSRIYTEKNIFNEHIINNFTGQLQTINLFKPYSTVSQKMRDIGFQFSKMPLNPYQIKIKLPIQINKHDGLNDVITMKEFFIKKLSKQQILNVKSLND